MVKPQQRREINGFSKGLITEINPLNSQIDTTVDELNFELKSDGTRTRRLGLNAEVGFDSFPVGTVADFEGSATSSFLWTGVAGDPNLEFFVIQIGAQLQIFQTDAGDRNQTIRRGVVNLPINKSVKVNYANLQGFLVVVTGAADIQLIQFNTSNSTFTRSSFRLRIRDFFGIEETIQPRYETDPLYRGALNWQHYYNLYNQGWAIPRRPWSPVSTFVLRDAVQLGANGQTGKQAPSNADKVWSGLTVRPRPDPGLTTFEVFNYDQFTAITGVEGYVSKGFFIIDAFNRGSSRQTEWNNHKSRYAQAGRLMNISPPADATSGGPTSIATHAGRIFYSGINGVVAGGDKRSPNYNNYVFFSQLVKNRQDFGKCYQEGDPTSRESYDLVDTDGGYIVIPDAQNIHTMYSLGDQLFLVADNGVWKVSGGSGYGFTATNYMVTRMSGIGGQSGSSFVELGGVGFYWGADGIYSLAKNQFGDYELTNISRPTIDRFYKAIPKESHTTVIGFSDKFANRVHWVYRVGSESRELVLDLNFNAFRPNSYGVSSNLVITGVHPNGVVSKNIDTPVEVGIDEVYAGADLVTVGEGFLTNLTTTAKYVALTPVSGNYRLTFCELRDPDFQDWRFTGTPVDAPAYMVTNAFTGGDFAIKKQVPWLTMAFAETEKRLLGDDSIDRESSCIGRMMWNFTHDARSGKWSREMQLYRKRRFYYGDFDIDNGFTLNITKSKLRGIGNSFSLRVDTEPLKACHIYGWSLSLNANTVT